MRQRFYWPHMAADIQSTVRNCHACAKNRIRLRKRTNPLKTFPATVPLRHVSIDILGALKKTKRGNRWILVMTDRFTKTDSSRAYEKDNRTACGYCFRRTLGVQVWTSKDSAE